jgi:hypothetical protein
MRIPQRESNHEMFQGAESHTNRSQRLQVVDIVDLREMYQAYLVRIDYGSRGPMTGTKRTVLKHDWETLPLASQVIEGLRYIVDGYGANDRSVLQNLRAIGFMARRDSASPRWLRTREQVDGGVYPSPLSQLRSRSEVEDFLIVYDIIGVSRMNGLQHSVAAIKENMRLRGASAYDILILQLARIHNCTFLLDQYPKPAVPQTPTATAVSTTTAQTPVTVTTSDAPAEDIPSSPSQATPNKTVQDVVSRYRLDQKLLEKQLYACRRSIPAPADRFESLFNHDIYRKQCWCTSLKNYPRVFEMIGRIPVSENDLQIAQTLGRVISGREEAEKFYQSFGASYSVHRNMIDVPKAGEAMLLWKTRWFETAD